MAKRVNVILPDDLAEQIDACTVNMHMSRSAWMVQAAAQAVTAQQMRAVLFEMFEAMKRLGMPENDDKETVRQLQTLMALFQQQ